MIDVVIAGAGPAGTLLATELCRSGLDVVLLERRTAATAGSRAIGLHPPGASFTMPGKERLDFHFRHVSRCGLPEYAYNVPPPAFAPLLDQPAGALRAPPVRARPNVEPDRRRGLPPADATLAAAPSPATSTR